MDKFTQGREECEPLFLSRFHNRMERTQCYRIINDACKKAVVDCKVGTHTLRKTFGYHHYQKFKDVAALQKIFNHYSQQVTLRYIGIDQNMIDNSYNNFILKGRYRGNLNKIAIQQNYTCVGGTQNPYK